MESRRRASASDLLGVKTLIVGDVGSGKTALTAQLLDELVELGHAPEITVIEMGPDRLGVGKTLNSFSSRIDEVRLLGPEGLRAPRLEGKNAVEVKKFAESNRKRIEPLLEEFQRSGTSILIMNDASIYVQAGNLEKLLVCVRKAETFVGNCYFGEVLADDKESGISRKERENVEILIGEMDRVMRLQPRGKPDV